MEVSICIFSRSVDSSPSLLSLPSQGFLGLKWAKWKRVLLTRSIAMVPCVILAIIASKKLDLLDELINVEQSILVS